MTNKWLPLAITQEDIAGGFTIVLTTDIPCHLFLYWTDKVPWVHRTSTIERGLAVPWDAYWCFVVWTILDQNEPGDTTTHTYTWTGWQVCQTKYFRFHGTIAGDTSPSDSPIFHKHYSYVAVEERFQYYDPPGENDWGSTYNARKVAQTFTVVTPHTISKVELKLHRYGSPGDLEAAITAVDGAGKPLLPKLCTGTTDGNTLPTDAAPYEWREITLGAGTDLAAATYAIILTQLGANAANYAEWRALNPGTYPGGQAWYGWDLINWWLAAWDHYFKEYGYAL